MAPDLIRIVFELDAHAWHGSATERLWAEAVGGGRYRLRNSPFFASDVSVNDVVFGELRDGEVHYKGVSIRGGHSTYRIIVASSVENRGFLEYWAPLQALGCTYESGRVLAVDVPSTVDIHAVYRLLEAGEKSGVWDFEEGHCGHPT